MNKHIAAGRGFSLVEVLIGLTLLAIGLCAIGTLQITSLRGNAFSNNLTQAIYLAQDRLEFLKNVPYDASQLLPGDYYNDRNVTISGMVFSGQYKITTVGGLRRIDYKVTWNDGKNHTVVFATVRSQ